MVIGGVVRNGVVIPDQPLAEGARVQIEAGISPKAPAVRRGGLWHGRVKISSDFDEFPEDIRQAFGMDDE